MVRGIVGQGSAFSFLAGRFDFKVRAGADAIKNQKAAPAHGKKKLEQLEAKRSERANERTTTASGERQQDYTPSSPDIDSTLADLDEQLHNAIVKASPAIDKDRDSRLEAPRAHRNKAGKELMSALDELKKTYDLLKAPNFDETEDGDRERLQHAIEQRAAPAIAKLAELELPALFSRPPTEAQGVHGRIVENMLGLWAKGMLSQDLIRIIAYDYSNLTDLSRHNTEGNIDQDEANAFALVLERANAGELPGAVLARFPHLTESITQIYVNDAKAHGEPEWIGKARAERQFAVAFIIDHLPTIANNLPAGDGTGLLELSRAGEDLVRDPDNLLQYFEAHPQQDHMINVLLAHISSLHQDAKVFDQLRRAGEGTREEQVLRSKADYLEARHEFDILLTRNWEIEGLQGADHIPAQLLAEHQELAGLLQTANEHVDETRQALIEIGDEQAVPPSKSDLASKYIDQASIRELGLPEPDAADLGRIISKLHSQGLLNTHDAAMATQDLNKFRQNIQARSPLNYMLNCATGGLRGFLNGILFLRNLMGRDESRGYYSFSAGRTIIQNRILANTVRTADQKSNRFEDLFYRWMAGPGHYDNHNLKASDDDVTEGWRRKLQASYPQQFKNGTGVVIDDPLRIKIKSAMTRIRIARDELRNAAETDIEDKHNALANAKNDLKNILGSDCYNLIHLSIVALTLSKREKGLVVSYQRLNQFNAVEYADEIATSAKELGIDRFLGVLESLGDDDADFKAFIDTEVAAVPTVVSPRGEKNEQQIEAIVKAETFRATDLDRELKSLERQIKKDGATVTAEPLYLDQLLSSVRSLPIQQKSTFILSKGRTSAFGFVFSIAAFFAPGKFSGVYQSAEIIEIKRGVKEFEVRIRSGTASGREKGVGVGMIGDIDAGDSEGEGRNKGVAFHFSSVEDVQKFLRDFFDEKKNISFEDWLTQASEVERAKQTSRTRGNIAGMGVTGGARYGRLEVSVAGHGAQYTDTASHLLSGYNNAKHSETKRKVLSERTIEGNARFMSLGSIANNNSNEAAAAANNVGGIANKMKLPSTGFSINATESFLRMTRRKEERNLDGKLIGAGFYTVLDIRGKDSATALRAFLAEPLNEKERKEIQPFLNAISNEELEQTLSETLLKTQQNETIAVESEIRPEILEIIQQWEELIDVYYGKLVYAELSDDEPGQYEDKIADLRRQIISTLNNPASFKPKAIMTVPKREDLTGSFVALYLTGFRMGIGTLREQSGYVPMPDDTTTANDDATTGLNGLKETFSIREVTEFTVDQPGLVKATKEKLLEQQLETSHPTDNGKFPAALEALRNNHVWKNRFMDAAIQYMAWHLGRPIAIEEWDSEDNFVKSYILQVDSEKPYQPLKGRLAANAANIPEDAIRLTRRNVTAGKDNSGEHFEVDHNGTAIKTNADGNCFFEAILRAISTNPHIEPTTEEILGLRGQLVSFIEANVPAQQIRLIGEDGVDT